MMRTLALFFGTDRVTFELTSNAPLAVKKSRVYRRFSAAADDVVNARIWLGIHFRFADLAARTQGERVAEWVVGHFLLPVDRGGHRDRVDEYFRRLMPDLAAAALSARRRPPARGRRAAWCCASAGSTSGTMNR